MSEGYDYLARAAYLLVGLFEIAMFAASALVLFTKNHKTPAILVGVAALVACLDFGISMAYPLVIEVIIDMVQNNGSYDAIPLIMAAIRTGFTALSGVQWGLVVIAVFVGRKAKN